MKNWAKNIKYRTEKGEKYIIEYTCPVCNEAYNGNGKFRLPNYVDRLQCDCGAISYFKVRK